MNVREQVVLFGAVTLSLLYFGSYLLLSLSFQAKIMDNLFFFCMVLRPSNLIYYWLLNHSKNNK